MLTYREFIDEMVATGRQSVTANRIREHGHPERVNESASPLDDTEAARKDLFLSLSISQREVLAGLITSEREGAVHDVLAYLEWAISTQGLKITGPEGAFVPQETMHGDFVARCFGWSWESFGR